MIRTVFEVVMALAGIVCAIISAKSHDNYYSLLFAGGAMACIAALVLLAR